MLLPATSHFKFSKFSTSLFLLGICFSLRAQDIPLPNKQDLLKQLDQVATQAQNRDQKRRSAAISEISSQASSGSAAVDFYLRALDSTRYKTNHPAFIDWDRQNDRILHTISFQTAVLLQLRYLVLALHRDDQHDEYAQVPEALAYLKDLAGIQSSTVSSQGLSQEALTFIQQPLTNSEVAQWLQISDLLPASKNFAPAPGIYEDIMEKNVRGPLRDKKDSRLPATWDTQIEAESAIAAASGDHEKIEIFNKSRLPGLLFRQVQDTALIGQPNRSIGEVMLLIQKYPGNPQVSDWINYARDALTKTSSGVAQTPGDSNATVPGPAPSAAPSISPAASMTPSPFGRLTPP